MIHSSNSPLREDELLRDERNAAKGLHADVKWKQIFGAKSDSGLANRVRMERPVLYQTLRTEYRYATGIERRPLEGMEE